MSCVKNYWLKSNRSVLTFLGYQGWNSNKKSPESCGLSSRRHDVTRETVKTEVENFIKIFSLTTKPARSMTGPVLLCNSFYVGGFDKRRDQPTKHRDLCQKKSSPLHHKFNRLVDLSHSNH